LKQLGLDIRTNSILPAGVITKRSLYVWWR